MHTWQLKNQNLGAVYFSYMPLNTAQHKCQKQNSKNYFPLTKEKASLQWAALLGVLGNFYEGCWVTFPEEKQ